MMPNGTRRATPLGIDHDAGWSAGFERSENALSAGDLLRATWRRLWVILLVALLLVSAAVGTSLLQTPMYQASIKVLIGQKQGLTGTTSDVIGLQQLTQSMAQLAGTRTVAEAVVQELDLQTTPDALLSNLSVEQIEETQVIQISYTDPDPEQASLIANTTGSVFSREVSEVSSSANSITATPWERAAIPESPVSPNMLRNGFLALVLGLMLGVGLAFLLEYLDDSWRSPEEAMQISGVPTFAAIREFKLPKRPKKRGES